MKNLKKIVLLALTVIFVVTCLASCAGSSGKLVMATNAAFPPYEYVDGGNYYGIDVEIAEEIAKRLGKTLRIEDIEFDSIIGGIESGKYDMALAGLTVTPDREKSVSFSTSYAKGVQVMIVKNDATFASIDDFFNYDAEGNPVSLKKTDLKVGCLKCGKDVGEIVPGLGSLNAVLVKNVGAVEHLGDFRHADNELRGIVLQIDQPETVGSRNFIVFKLINSSRITVAGPLTVKA